MSSPERDGVVVGELHSPIRPPEQADWFDPFNIGIPLVLLERPPGQPWPPDRAAAGRAVGGESSF